MEDLPPGALGGDRSRRLPPRSPNLNAFAERFVLSAKSECLNKIVPLGERHLRASLQSFVEHYHRERHHRGLDNQLIQADPPAATNTDGPVKCRERLGGTLKFYAAWSSETRGGHRHRILKQRCSARIAASTLSS